jgi:hypothetical protein
MRTRRLMAALAAAVLTVTTAAVAGAAPPQSPRPDGDILNRPRCMEASGTWTNDRGIHRCVHVEQQVVDHDDVDEQHEQHLSDPEPAPGGPQAQFRATVRVTTVTTLRTTTVVRLTESQRGAIGNRGTASTYESSEEVLDTDSQVLEVRTTRQLEACERRTGNGTSWTDWAPAPSTDCRDRFDEALIGPAPQFLDPDTAARCEFLDPTECLLVWPTDHLTVPDPTTDTGRRLNLQAPSLPKNLAGAHIDPTEFNRNDGFSPGTPVLARVPGLDLAQTGAPPITDLSRSLEPDSPMVIINADTGERHLMWAELDPDAPSEDQRALYLRAGVNYDEGQRYIVAMRRLKDASGATIEANPVFATYRDDVSTDVPHVEARRSAMEDIFARLAAAGIARDDLYLAWDFTVASQRNLSERMLHIRDDAFADLGPAPPTFNVTNVEELTPAQDSEIVRRVEATVSVPLYLTGTGAPGNGFNWGPSGLPQRNGSMIANVSCRIPRSASAVDPARISLYGHGLLGSRGEVNAGNVRQFANEHNVVFCATDWSGMSNEDIPTVVTILQNMSNFYQLADRLQQGILNTLFVGRTMKHDGGFATHPAFQDGGVPLIDTSELFFDGNSQGAIIGGAATAVAQDWTRATLGVGGMNYSLLLRRSSNWPLYESILNTAYPGRLDQTLLLAMIQTQWDRGETNGYAHHITSDPYPNTPPKQILMHIAFADFQVTMWSADIMARTIGATLRQPAMAPGRHPDTNPFFGIPTVPGDGYTGSVMVYWDSGTPPPPIVDRPPSAGTDPHGRPRAQPSARLQKSHFFDGVFIDVCGTDPCLAP